MTAKGAAYCLPENVQFTTRSCPPPLKSPWYGLSSDPTRGEAGVSVTSVVITALRSVSPDATRVANVAQSAALAIWIVSACAETVLIASASGIKNDAVLFMLVLISGLLLWIHYAAEEDYQAGAGFSNEEDERGRGLALPDCLRRSGGLAEGKRHASCDRCLDSPVAYSEGN